MATRRGNASSADGSVSVIDLSDRPDARGLLDRLYQQVLIPSFRKEELESFETMASALTEVPRNTDIAAACDESGEILGAMIGDWDPPSGVYLLSYLAARPGLRSRGIGTCLMRQLPVWSRARRALVTLAEVDDPRCHHNEGLVGDPSARLDFYGRFGARVLDLPYFQPSLGPDGQRAHGMLLIAFDVDDAGLTGGPVPALRGDVLGTWLRGYFEDAEGMDKSQENGDDVDRARILDQASAAAGVRILPLDQYTEVSRDIASK
jgi:GNAT superfamily N-acetyltransferase